jgi:polysaccharide pyruvyl transferase WcaK-like protein
MSRDYRKHVRDLSLGILSTRALATKLFTPASSRHPPEESGEHIVILGGEVFNKGAQAMTFTVVDRLSRRYPDKEIHLFSRRYSERSADEERKFRFSIHNWSPEAVLSVLSPKLGSLVGADVLAGECSELRDILRDCHCIVDVSGYALSSQLQFSSSFLYVLNIIVAEEYGIPLYILPQSIGPFDYEIPKSLILNPLLQVYLPSPETICARERDGVQSLSRYTRHNVHHEYDIVLQNDKYCLENVFTDDGAVEYEEVTEPAVAIVPNSNVFERSDPATLDSLYESAIERLLAEGRTVYLLVHSSEDTHHCQRLKERYPEDDRVVVIGEQMNAVELEETIRQFDFLIASRYHSIIHAYKHAVPVIAIGWAVKYRELLRDFDQSEYFFDGREAISEADLNRTIETLLAQLEAESTTIQAKMDEVQESGFFDKYLP